MYQRELPMRSKTPRLCPVTLFWAIKASYSERLPGWNYSASKKRRSADSSTSHGSGYLRSASHSGLNTSA